MKFKISLLPSARRALTLVEVLAALVLLGTILTGLVMAKSHHTRQLALTAERQNAVRLADHLISHWWTSPQGIPIDQRGAVDRDSRWVWETRLVENDALQTSGVRVVRVIVRPGSVDAVTVTDDPAALSVDLALPDPEWIRAHNKNVESRENSGPHDAGVSEHE